MPKKLHNRINRKELKQEYAQSNEKRLVISFYRYFKIELPALFRNQLYEALDAMDVKGRIYVANEGINAQISLPDEKFEILQAYLESIPGLFNLRLNIAVESKTNAFFALIIKVKNKIVADGIDDPGFDPSKYGTHLKAKDFNDMISNPKAILVDMRNHYESEVGHFKNAIRPEVTTFRESLPMIAELLADKKNEPIVMYCTGGIRCEKASAYMRYRGFKDVYQLEGGIIKYAHEVHDQGLDNLFIGKNFVFDERLGERISNEIIAHCHQCGTICDEHTNCANDACHILFIQCPVCAAKYDHTCSQKCADFIKLPKEQQIALRKTEVFNGSKFSKGRYKAHKNTEGELV